MESGFARSGDAQLYYEVAGAGADIVLLHAGVADSRQWNETFEELSQTHRVMRYDMRGFGRSEPVAGDFKHIADLEEVLAAAGVTEPVVLVGCSMGGTLAMDYTLAHPHAVSALVMVCSGPSGLQLDVPQPQKFEQVASAEKQGDLDLVCELETQIWFDGLSRNPSEVDAAKRALLYDMNRLALTHQLKELGDRQRDLQPAAHQQLGKLKVPVLIITGALDLPYTQAAADYMSANIGHASVGVIENAAHLPNMEQPALFNRVVHTFVNEHT